MQRIVVATDDSAGGNRAVEAAAELARVTGCKLLILTVGGSISGAELRQLAGTEGKRPTTRVLREAQRRSGAVGKDGAAFSTQEIVKQIAAGNYAQQINCRCLIGP
jgi:nucleotide-binding universal stress UspA family protein